VLCWIFPELTEVIAGYGLARLLSNVKFSGGIKPGSATHWEPLRNMLGGQVQSDAFSLDTGLASGQSNVVFCLQDLFAGHPWQVDTVDGSMARICRSRNPQGLLPVPLIDMLMYLAVRLLQVVTFIMVLMKVVPKLARLPEL
jgi:hypothetical protein